MNPCGLHFEFLMPARQPAGVEKSTSKNQLQKIRNDVGNCNCFNNFIHFCPVLFWDSREALGKPQVHSRRDFIRMSVDAKSSLPYHVVVQELGDS